MSPFAGRAGGGRAGGGRAGGGRAGGADRGAAGQALRLALWVHLVIVPLLTATVFLSSPVQTTVHLLRISVRAFIFTNAVCLVVAIGFIFVRQAGFSRGGWALPGLALLPLLGVLGVTLAQQVLRHLPIAAGVEPSPRLSFFGALVAVLYGLALYNEERYRRTLGAALGKLQQARQRQRELARARDAAELARLRALVEPHFLFNAFNTLTALIRADPDRAEVISLALARLFRHVLAGDETELAPLHGELEAVADYLAVENARLGGRLGCKIDLPEPLRDTPVPSLLLLPLVENAVKHGAAQRRNGGRVELSVTAGESHLTISVRDDGPGVSDDVGTGRGLALVRERLELHYQGRASLALERDPSRGETVARVELPIAPMEWST